MRIGNIIICTIVPRHPNIVLKLNKNNNTNNYYVQTQKSLIITS